MKPVFFRMAIDSAAHLIQLVSASAHLFLMSRGGCISLWSKAPVSWNFLLDLLSASGIGRWVSPDLQGGTQRYEQKTQTIGLAIGVKPDPEMIGESASSSQIMSQETRQPKQRLPQLYPL